MSRSEQVNVGIFVKRWQNVHVHLQRDANIQSKWKHRLQGHHLVMVWSILDHLAIISLVQECFYLLEFLFIMNQ